MSPNPVAPPADKSSSSYYSQVRQQVVDVIANANLGDRVPSERVLAQQLGTSTLTVGRVLQELQRDGFVQRTPGRGTFISRPWPGQAEEVLEISSAVQEDAGWNPLTLKSVASQGIAAPVVIFARMGLAEEYWRRLEHWPSVAVSRIERTLQGLGHQTIVVNLESVPEDEILHTMNSVRDTEVKTAIHVALATRPVPFPTRVRTSETWAGVLQQWREDVEPAVVNLSFGRPLAPGDTVSFDNGWGAYLAARHLRELGHRRVAYVTPEVDFTFLDERWDNIQQAFITEPDAYVERVRITMPTPLPSLDAEIGPWEFMGRAAAEQLREDDRFTALLMVNDGMAKGFLETVGRDVISRISVVGFDDHLFSAGLGLTTVHVPVEQMAEQTALLAIHRQRQPSNESWLDMVFKPQLITRASTRPA